MHRKYPQSAGWDVAEHLMATQIDALQALFNLLLAANSKDAQYEPPKPIDRPGDAEREAERVRQVRKDSVAIRGIVAQLLPPKRR